MLTQRSAYGAYPEGYPRTPYKQKAVTSESSLGYLLTVKFRHNVN